VSDLVCSGEGRRDKVRAGSNGLDYLEVSADQLTLTVTFLGKAPDEVEPANVRIDGGRRVRGIRVVRVRLSREEDPDLDDCMQVTVDRPGDFSTYTLRLVDPDKPERPPAGIDPRYAALQFSFKVGCSSDLDCAVEPDCPPAPPPVPDISYLAKDYASFRALILDRLALVMPGWTERHAPDLGIALVELLAYVGDHLSYQQDAVATEAYLDTARRRISVRRHARLVDYALHDGCNARAWVCVEVEAPVRTKSDEVCFVAAPAQTPFPRVALGCDELRTLQAAGSPVFEPVADAPPCAEIARRGDPEPRLAPELRFDPDHNAISFWTWGDSECCLTAGATSATLKDRWVEIGEGKRRQRTRALSLHPGDLLVFEERIGPQTGDPADADPDHRQAVRLTQVTQGSDPLYEQPIVEVTWGREDALDFPLCISTFAGEDCARIDDVSVACGNVVLIDHGATLGWCDSAGDPLPPRTAGEPGPACEGPCDPAERLPVPAAYGPVLAHRPVSQVTAFPDPAALAGRQAEVVAAIPARVHARIARLVEDARDGAELGEHGRGELVALFGSRTLTDAGLLRARGAPQELAALERLSARADHLLAGKVRRTFALAERARDRNVLPLVIADELLELWGERYAARHELQGPGLLGPARGVLAQDPRAALPAISVDEGPVPKPAPPRGGRKAKHDDAADRHRCWEPRRDLLHSGPGDRHFVAEADDDGDLHLRFGPGVREVPVGAPMTAHYRLGNGRAGNVGRESISRIVFRTRVDAPVLRVRNPLAATGGADPEPVPAARLAAPMAFRHVRERAVTAGDYAELAGQVPDVQRAAARLRWTGSWFEADVGLDVLSAAPDPDAVPAAVAARLRPARRLGHDLRVATAAPTALDLAMTVCVAADHRAAPVRAALLDVLSDRTLADGTLGFFHPDALSFGSAIRLSALVAVAQAVPGVELVKVTQLGRLSSSGGPPDDGVLDFGPLEIPELANDPNEPERGRLQLELRGGR